MLSFAFLVVFLSLLASASSVSPPREYVRTEEQHPSHPKACGPCPEGFCSFTNCGRVERAGSGKPALPEASCGGGLCDYYSCTGGTCSGGACTFVKSDLSSCEGGGVTTCLRVIHSRTVIVRGADARLMEC
jgi:hypothetical protein